MGVTLLHRIIIGCILFCSLPLVVARAQNNGTENRAEIKALKDSLRVYDEQIDLQQHFLEAATVDKNILEYATIKSWVINNPTLRDSLFYALLQADSSIQSEAGSDPQVLATPTNDLIEVRFGSAVFKGMTLKNALEKSQDKYLYTKVAESYRYSRDVELRDPAFKLETPLQPELLGYDKLLDSFNPVNPQWETGAGSGAVEMALSDIETKIGPRWGGEARLGVDVVNLPFWSNGTVEFLAAYKRYRFGFVMPIAIGRQDVELFPPFLFRARRLTGARGFLGEFDFGALGGLFYVARFWKSDLHTATDPNEFYYLSGVVNLFYSFGISLDPTNLVRAKVGLGGHRVTPATAQTTSSGDVTILLSEHTNIISPYVKIEYMNKDVTERYSASVQYYNLTLMFAGSLEIVPGYLSIEAKYVWPLGTIRAWEYPELFYISPRLRIPF